MLITFTGSRQSASTYDDTYSPTVKPESIRIFHVYVYAVETGWDIRQYDVPQAFLQSPVDHDIFVHPPRANIEFPGQILKLRLVLYGAKQSSALFYKLLNSFLLKLGFVSSTMDACFYKRHNPLLIAHVDDMRCAGTPEALMEIHTPLLQRFRIITGDGTRFLGMDTAYDLTAGVLSMGMTNYIQSTIERFQNIDLSLGVPCREIFGCLLWIVLCVVGPELVGVKDLARRCNAPTPSDYNDALKVLKRIFKRRNSAILFKRGYAGRNLIPSQVRSDPPVISLATTPIFRAASPPGNLTQEDVLDYFDSRHIAYNIQTTVLPTSTRFVTLAYTDASFAVDDSKDSNSIFGLVIFVNGTPVMWGSTMRQIAIADSTCAAEFVAASVCCKQLVHVENSFRFLGFVCPKPYTVHCLHGFAGQPSHINELAENGENSAYCNPISSCSRHVVSW
jgi:hypothetical protein